MQGKTVLDLKDRRKGGEIHTRLSNVLRFPTKTVSPSTK